MTSNLQRTILFLVLHACSLSAHAIRIDPIPDTRPDLLEPDFMTTGFEGAAGPVSGSESVFTDIGLSKVGLGRFTFTGSPPQIVQQVDTLNTDVDGNALVAQRGSMAIAGPGERFDLIQASSGFLFEIEGLATQVGFRIVDQPGLYIDLILYLNGNILGTRLIRATGSIQRFLTYEVGFDAFAIRASNIVPVGGWGLDDIGLGGKMAAPVPTPGTLWLAGIGLVMLRRHLVV